MKKNKYRETLQFLVILISVLLIIGGVTFLTMFELLDSPTGMAHKPSHNPGGGGAGGGGDTGGGSTSGETTTPGTTTVSGGTKIIKPVRIVYQTPQEGGVIKKGNLTIIVEGFEGEFLSRDLEVTAESPLFGIFELENNFKDKGNGVYGASIPIKKDIQEAKYSIIVKGETEDSIDVQRILVDFDPKIYINMILEKDYNKGERINFEGSLTYGDKTPVTKGAVELLVTASKFRYEKEIIPVNESFSDSFLISFAEPDGPWNIRLTAKDENNNAGTLDILTQVLTPKGVVYYSVTFSSPFENSDFKRGSAVPITIKLTEEENTVENATVEFRNPKGELIQLEDLGEGTYNGVHIIGIEEPLGTWYLSVQALKVTNGITKAGGNSLPITVRPSTMNLILLNPKTTSFFAGLKIKIKIGLSYPDGTKVENAEVIASIGNQTIILNEIEPGIYSEDYMFTELDVGIQSLQVKASDINKNFVSTPAKAIIVDKVGPVELKLRLFYYKVILKYWYILLAGFLLILMITQPVWHGSYLRSNLKKMIVEEKRIIEMEKDTQRKYFKEHSITRGDYDKLMLKYRERASDLKEKNTKTQKALINLRPKKK